MTGTWKNPCSSHNSLNRGSIVTIPRLKSHSSPKGDLSNPTSFTVTPPRDKKKKHNTYAKIDKLVIVLLKKNLIRSQKKKKKCCNKRWRIPSRAIKEREFTHEIQTIVDEHEITATHHSRPSWWDLPEKACCRHERRFSPLLPFQVVSVPNLFSTTKHLESVHVKKNKKEKRKGAACLRIPSKDIFTQVDLLWCFAKTPSVNRPKSVYKIGVTWRKLLQTFRDTYRRIP